MQVKGHTSRTQEKLLCAQLQGCTIISHKAKQLLIFAKRFPSSHTVTYPLDEVTNPVTELQPEFLRPLNLLNLLIHFSRNSQQPNFYFC